MQDRTTRNIANGGESDNSAISAHIKLFPRWIGTHSANRHLPYCKPLQVMPDDIILLFKNNRLMDIIYLYL